MPTKPKIRKGEPIRLTTTPSGATRFQVIMDAPPQPGRVRSQVRRNFRSIAEARAFVDDTRVSIRRGTYVPNSSVTMSALAERWLQVQQGRVASGELRQVTVSGYRTWLGSVLRQLGDRPVSKIAPSDVEKWAAWALAEGNAKTKTPGPLSPRSVAASLRVLRQVLDLAVRDRLIATNPAADVPPPSRGVDETEERAYWSPGQVARFLATVDQLHAEGRLTLALALGLHLAAAGLRRSEVAGLTWDAVDIDAGTVAVLSGRVVLPDGSASTFTPPKSRASRRAVPVEEMAPGTVRLLRLAWVAAGQPAIGQTVTDREGKPKRPAGVRRGPAVLVDAAERPIRPESVSDAFARVGRAAELPDLWLHGLRHSVATDLANDAEVSDKAAADLLGHDVETFIRTYSHHSAEAVRLAGVRFGARVTAALAAAE